MSIAVPPPEVIRLTTANPYPDRLPAPMGSAEKRSPLCGSRVTIDIDLDAEGRVAAIGTRVLACAFGQAAATIVARHAIGRTPADLDGARAAMARWMAGEGDAPDWPEIDHLAPDRLNTVRKGSVQLAFQAAAEAAALARRDTPR
jgi:NifU-like protein involved in Fe-S cluster formation